MDLAVKVLGQTRGETDQGTGWVLVSSGSGPSGPLRLPVHDAAGPGGPRGQGGPRVYELPKLSLSLSFGFGRLGLGGRCFPSVSWRPGYGIGPTGSGRPSSRGAAWAGLYAALAMSRGSSRWVGL